MKIVWSKTAKFDYWKNIEFLEENWTEKEVIYFVDQVEFVLNQLKSNKVIFQSSDYKKTFQVPILKQVTLFYMKKAEQSLCYDSGITTRTLTVSL